MQTWKTGFSSRSETIIMGRSNTERWAWVTCFSLLSGWNSSLTVKSIKNKWNSQKNLHSMKCMECTKKKAQHCICASVNFAISAFIPVMHWSAQVHNCTSAQLHKCTSAQLPNCTARGGKVCNWVCKQSLFTTEYGVDREKETTKIFFKILEY